MALSCAHALRFFRIVRFASVYRSLRPQLCSLLDRRCDDLFRAQRHPASPFAASWPWTGRGTDQQLLLSRLPRDAVVDLVPADHVARATVGCNGLGKQCLAADPRPSDLAHRVRSWKIPGDREPGVGHYLDSHTPSFLFERWNGWQWLDLVTLLDVGLDSSGFVDVDRDCGVGCACRIRLAQVACCCQCLDACLLLRWTRLWDCYQCHSGNQLGTYA